MADPRGIRNNNFGNIKDGPFAQGLPGYQGSDGTFATFSSPEYGWGAMDNLLTGYGKKGHTTPTSIIGRWAPTSDGNDVGAYAQHVSSKMGVGPNDNLDMSDPQVRSKLAQAMAGYENGEGPMKAAFGAAPTTGNNKMPSPTGLDQSMLDYQQQKPPALSANGVMGPGALTGWGLSDGVVTNNGKPVYDAANSMQNAGAWLMGINDPKALGALGSLKKGENEYTFHTNASGSMFRYNKNGKAQYLGQDPGLDDANKRTVEKTRVEEQNKQFDKLYGDLQSRGTDAQSELGLVQQTRDLLSKKDANGRPLVDQGFAGELGLQAKSLYKALGGDPSGLSEGQTAQALLNQLTLKIKNAGGQNSMPGSMSDSDLKFLMNSNASLGKDPAANAEILDRYERSLKRSQAIAELARNHNGGRLDNSFYDKVSAHDQKQSEQTTRKRGMDAFWLQ